MGKERGKREKQWAPPLRRVTEIKALNLLGVGG